WDIIEQLRATLTAACRLPPTQSSERARGSGLPELAVRLRQTIAGTPEARSVADDGALVAATGATRRPPRVAGACAHAPTGSPPRSAPNAVVMRSLSAARSSR